LVDTDDEDHVNDDDSSVGVRKGTKAVATFRTRLVQSTNNAIIPSQQRYHLRAGEKQNYKSDYDDNGNLLDDEGNQIKASADDFVEYSEPRGKRPVSRMRMMKRHFPLVGKPLVSLRKSNVILMATVKTRHQISHRETK
jgi:hypothetical protein